MVVSCGCGFNELLIMVFISVYYDIGFDMVLIVGIMKNVKCNRCIVVGVIFFVGVIVGGWMYKGIDGSMVLVLWVVVGIKILGVVVWFVWKLEEDK